MIRVITENVGYRELDRLGTFLMYCSSKAELYTQINTWLQYFDMVEIGYDLHYDEPYIENEVGAKLYASDFDVAL